MIKHISFYKDGKRMIITPGPTGLFSIIVPATTSSGYPTTKSVELTAAGLVNHSDYKDYDPTLTLEDGKKVRVYHAGNSHIPIVYPSLIIDDFDKMWRKKREKKSAEFVKEKLKTKKREEQTTQPIAGLPPLIPPPPARSSNNKKVTISNSPPSKALNPGADPFASVIDEWFGPDEDDDPNDGLYDSGYYPYDDDYED